jgi:hypothetical protein
VIPDDSGGKLIPADIIDSKNQEIRPESDDVYSKMEDLADELPESAPRFILLSYPLTMVSEPATLLQRAGPLTVQESGRLTVPYVLLYFLPENCNPSLRMMYAGAVELMRSTAEVNRVLEVQTEEDITTIEARLKGAD